MWMLLAEIGIEVGLWAINKYLVKQPLQRAPQPDEFKIATTVGGVPIPLVYGTIRTNSPVLVWHGNHYTQAGAGGTFNYGADMIFAVGIPAYGVGATLRRIWWGEIEATATPAIGFNLGDGRSTPLVVPLSGPASLDAVIGFVEFFGGSPTQNPMAAQQFNAAGQNSGPTSIFSQVLAAFALAQGIDTTTIPGYRNQIMLVVNCSQINGGTIGFSPSIPQIGIEIQSLGSDPIGGLDANPAWVLYDLLTGPVWKLGIPLTEVDKTSFQACATTLVNEGNGISIAIDAQRPAAQILVDILKQIDGTLYQDPATGLIKLRLIRHDYVSVSSLPQITADNTMGNASGYSNPQYTTTYPRGCSNQVRVRFTDRTTITSVLNGNTTVTAQRYQQESVIAQKLSNLFGQDNRIRELVVDYPGCTNGTLAVTLAARDLNAVGVPRAAANCYLNRSFYGLVPGDAVAVTWPQFNISQKVMRVTTVDLGQLAKGAIRVTLVEDVFDNAAGAYGGVVVVPFRPIIYPLTQRPAMECPRYWSEQQALIDFRDPERPYLYQLATPDNSGPTVFTTLSKLSTGLQGSAAPQFQVDLVEHPFPSSCTLVNSYARTLEPYDTTSNQLVIQGLTGLISTIDPTTVTGANGAMMLLIVEASGAHEFVSFDSITSLGGGQYRINGVWRGLIDTPPIDHAAGARAYFVGDTTAVGTRSYACGKTAKVQAVPRWLFQVGSGEDPIDSITTTCRALRPYPAANQGIGGDNITGSLGIPAVANRYKVVTLLEEGFDLYGTQRARQTPTTVRGDVTDEPLIETTRYLPMAAVAGTAIISGQQSLTFGPQPIALYHQLNPAIAFAFSDFTISGAVLSGVLGNALWTLDGYGSIDVSLVSWVAPPLDSRYGINKWTWSGGGVGVGNHLPPSNYNGFDSFPCRVNVLAPTWRNLLTNVRFNYTAAGIGPSNLPAGWDAYGANSGTAVIGSSSFSISLLSSGNGSRYLASSSTTLIRGQVVPLNYNGSSNWLPRGLTAVLAGYIKNASSDSNDTGQLQVEAYGTPISGGTIATAATAATVGGSTTWTRISTSLLLPVNTSALGARWTALEVGGGTGGTGNADTCLTEAMLRVGQWGTTNGLANYSFESGSLASWTQDSGSWVTTTTNASPSAICANCQTLAAGTYTIHQDYALPTGFEYGTAILEAWAYQTTSGLSREIKIQVLDGSNNVLATATTGTADQPTMGAWYRSTLHLDTVDGAAKIRVSLSCTSAGGGANVFFDEAVLWYAKHIEASSSTQLTFDTPTVQPMPTTWQEYHLAYPANVANPPIPAVFSGNSADGVVEWSDGATHPVGSISGQFGGGVTSVNAYSFTRGGPYLRPAGTTVTNNLGGSYGLAQSFTALCYFRVDEPGFASVCGLFGRMNQSRGWGINITAAGQLQALLRGTGNTTASVASGRSVVEGALHMAAIVYNSGAQTLSIYDEQGLGASVSTASLGEFAPLVTDVDAYLRFGSDDGVDPTMPGMIAPVFLWGQALTAPQIAAHWNYAKDPTGLITTYTRTAAAIVPIGPTTACVMSAAQVALAFNATLTNDGGTGFGLAVGKSTTNLLPDTSFASPNWTARATLTPGIADPTGRPRGVQVAGDASNGITARNIPLASAPATVPVVFWAKLVSGGPTLNVTLLDNSGNPKNTQSVTLTTAWAQYTVNMTSWDGLTANAQLTFISASGAMTFVLAGIMCVVQGTDLPAILPLPGQTHGNYNAALTTTLPKQFNYEGELIAQGVGMIGSPTPAAATLLQATIGTSANLRELQVISGSTGFRCIHNDSAGTGVTATAAYSSYASNIWKARARWALAGMLDNVSPQDFSAVAWSDNVSSTPTVVTGRTATWTITATNLTTLNIGTGTASPSDVILRSVTARAREEKLP